MSLKDKIMNDVKNAMKSRQTERLNTLRFLQAAIKYREIELRPNAISDQDVLAVIKKLAKQRHESIDQFEKGGREDLALAEKNELKILEEFLPAQMSREQVESLVTQVIADLGATSVKQMGAVIKEVGLRSKGAADNRIVSELVKSRL